MLDRDPKIQEEVEALAYAWEYIQYPLEEIAAGFLGWQHKAKVAEARVKELEEAIRTHKDIFGPLSSAEPEDYDEELWTVLREKED